MSKNPTIGLWFTATITIFFTRALLFSTWQTRGPEVQSDLGLDTAQMGWFVMLYPIGGVIGILLASELTNRYGPAKLTIAGFAISALALVGLGFTVPAGQIWTSSILLLVMGFPMAIADFTGNFEGSEVDKRSPRALFPLIHGTYGIGMIVAANLSGFLMNQNVSLANNYFMIAAIVALASIWAGTVFPARANENITDESKAVHRQKTKLAWSERRSQLLAIVGFSFIVAEIGAGTWVPIALTKSGFSGAEAASAFGLMWIVITLTRSLGGFLVDRIGRSVTVLYASIITGSGILIFIFDSTLHLPYLGLVLWGGGLALGFPLSVSAMSDDPAKSGARINMIISTVYIGSIAAGPLLGVVGSMFNIFVAFSVPLLLMVIAGALSPVTKPEKL
jgi:predicted MFS family arabinose efflux permease